MTNGNNRNDKLEERIHNGIMKAGDIVYNAFGRWRDKNTSIHNKVVRSAYLTGLIYVLGLSAPEAPSYFNSKKIAKENIPAVIETEREKLGIDKKFKINLKFNPLIYGGRKTGDNEYMIIMPNNPKLAGIKHELYHIAAGHADDHFKRDPITRAWRYFTKYEPEAAGHDSVANHK